MFIWQQLPLQMNRARFFPVKSSTDPHKVYMVRQLSTGEWVCGCPSFIFRNTCKHVQKIKNQQLQIKPIKH